MSEKEMKEEVVENVEETTKNSEKEKKTKNLEMVPKQEYQDLEDRYKRILAEFENFKKRSGKEREALYSSILSDVVEVILPIMDNLENASKVATTDENYKQGIELVLKQFREVLKSKGVEEIQTKGMTFDPELHEAVSSIQNPEMGAKEIAEEFRKGYKIGNKVIRHSMVVVAN